MTLTTRTLETPIGELRARRFRASAYARSSGPAAREGDLAPEARAASLRCLDEAARQLGEYFTGARTAFDLPLDLVGHAVPARTRGSRSPRSPTARR